MNHLTRDELVDAVEGALAPERRSHLSECAACAEEAESLGAMLRAVHNVPMVEPSPLFWNHFSARVHAAIAAEEAPPASRLPEWLRWPVLAPLAALALLLLAIGSTLPRLANESSPAAVTARGAAGDRDLATLGENEWALVSDIVGPVDVDIAQEAGIIVKPGDVERAALDLSASEQRELLRLLKEEMDRSGG